MQFLYPTLAFVGTICLVLLLKPVAPRLGLMDIPNQRKAHVGSIPLVGGLAMFGAVLLTAAFSSMLPAAGAGTLGDAWYLLAISLLVLVGAVDDSRDLSPATRFGVQIVCAVVMIFGCDIVLRDVGQIIPGLGIIELGWFGVPFTVFAVIGVINAFNMIDGLDGLSGSLALVSLAGLAVADIAWGTGDYGVLMAVLCATLAGFLLFNMRWPGRSKASIFMGDAGSMFMGFSIAWLATALCQGEDRALSPAAMLFMVLVPVVDAIVMMTRRMLKGRSPFEADKEHLHHIFLLAGYSVPQTVLIMSGMAVFGVVLGLGMTWLALPEPLIVGVFLVLGGLYFWAINRAWRVMRFLKRSICRRDGDDRRNEADADWAGPERRSTDERRGG